MQFIGGSSMIAKKGNAADLNFGMLVNPKPDIDFGGAYLLEFIADLRHIKALLDVQVTDLIGIALDLSDIQNLPLFQIQHLVDLIERDLLQSGHINLIDRRLLFNDIGDNQPFGGRRSFDLDVVKEAHGPQCLDVLLDPAWAVLVADSAMKVDAHSISFDLLVPFKQNLDNARRRT